MKPNAIIGLEVTLAVGCPMRCDYCPQDALLEAYRKRAPNGPRAFTLETFQKCAETIPTSRAFTFMGACEPAMCKDWVQIIEWAHQRGHLCSLSTNLCGVTKEQINAIAKIPLRDTIIHIPANDGRMALEPLDIDGDYAERFAYAVEKLRHHDEFVISCYSEPHPKLRDIWLKSGVQVRHLGLHDREGLIQWCGHQRLKGKLPICGKLFCGHLFPNGDVCRCCGDYAMVNCWGNLFENSYAEIMNGEKWHQYMRDRQDENKNTPCRYCGDAHKELNPEDRASPYNTEGVVTIPQLSICTNGTCQNRCVHCAHMGIRQHMGDYQANPSEIWDLVRRFQSLGCRVDKISFCGPAEPTLWQHLNEGVRIVASSGIGNRIILSTNGKLLSRLADDVWPLFSTVEISEYGDDLDRAMIATRTNVQYIPRPEFAVLTGPMPNPTRGYCCCPGYTYYRGMIFPHCGPVMWDAAKLAGIDPMIFGVRLWDFDPRKLPPTENLPCGWCYGNMAIQRRFEKWRQSDV